MIPDDLMKRVATVARDEGADPRLRDVEPLTGAARDRIAENVASALRARQARARPAAAQRASGWRDRVAWVAGPLALAAAIALFVTWRGGDGDALPPYALTVSGSDAPLRSGPAEDGANGAEVRVSRDGRLRIVLQPQSAVRGPIAARVFVAHEADVRPWRATTEVSADGAVRVTAGPEALADLGAGPWTVLVFAGRERVLPIDADAARRAAATAAPPEEWLARVPLTITP